MSTLQSPQTLSRWSGVFLSSVSLVGSILEHGVPHWTLVFAGCDPANPTFFSSSGLVLFFSRFFVCDFVLPFDMKDGPQASVNESLHFVCGQGSIRSSRMCYVHLLVAAQLNNVQVICSNLLVSPENGICVNPTCLY